jgi:hypothetical protein
MAALPIVQEEDFSSRSSPPQPKLAPLFRASRSNVLQWPSRFGLTKRSYWPAGWSIFSSAK